MRSWYPSTFLNWCPSIRVTVLLVFILLHCSKCSGRYLAAPYHAEEFTQNHTDMTQPQLLTALNWTIRTACSIIIFMLSLIITINMLVVIAVSVFFFSFLVIAYSTLCTMCCTVKMYPEYHLLSPNVMNSIQIHICYCNASFLTEVF